VEGRGGDPQERSQFAHTPPALGEGRTARHAPGHRERSRYTPRFRSRDRAPQTIDLKKVARLIDALERDLAKVQSGSRDVQLLRDEVETLKNVLTSPIRRPHWVREGLHGMRQAIENGLETIVADGLKA